MLEHISYAAVLGITPALIWLWFWLKEDNLHPEPKKVIANVFLGGMSAVILAIPLQQLVQEFTSVSEYKMLVWALIEEVLKFGIVWFYAYHKKTVVDEPVDPMIYMITAALGFAAMENMLFVFDPIQSHDLITGIITGTMRFIGATLVHVASSAVIGFALGITFYTGWFTKLFWRLISVSTALSLHFSFNLFIIKSSGEDVLIIFSFVWLAIFIVLILFEWVKRLEPPPPKYIISP